MQSPVQTASVAEKIVQSVLSNMGFIVPIAELVGKLVDRVVDEGCSREIKEASTTTAGTTTFIELAPADPTRPPKIPSDSKSQEKLHQGCCHRRSPT